MGSSLASTFLSNAAANAALRKPLWIGRDCGLFPRRFAEKGTVASPHVRPRVGRLARAHSTRGMNRAPFTKRSAVAAEMNMVRRRWPSRLIGLGLVVATLVATYSALFEPWYRNWGATVEETQWSLCLLYTSDAADE